MLLQTQVWAFLLLQEASPIGWDPRSLWAQMGVPAKLVVILLFLMSAWSIGVMIDRLLAYSAARKQSRAFAPAVAGALKEGKLDEAETWTMKPGPVRLLNRGVGRRQVAFS